jgi:hypothetical protein
MDGLCTVSRNSRGDKKSSGARISVSSEAMKAMRWGIGDRVKFAFDIEARLILIARTPDWRIMLTPPNGKTSDHAGEVKTATIQAAVLDCFLPLLPAVATRCKWKPDAQGLVIQLP